MHDTAKISVADLLSAPPGGSYPADAHLWGFGGVHGGLVAALITADMLRADESLVLHGITATFHRTLKGDFVVESETTQAGRSVTSTAGRAVSDGVARVTATGVFGTPRSDHHEPVSPPLPAAVPPPEECEVFTIPPELAPIAEQTQIRPVGANRPYEGGTEPELTAWVRIQGDDRPPDVLRFIFLMDALAPSYAAVLSVPLLIPTIELAVRPAPSLADASSPWVLLRARAEAVTSAGWVDERIDAWGFDGTYLGAAHQLRIVRSG